jgi:prepilin signal peptidase PulO-like enzyme (type II secretory pathway)
MDDDAKQQALLSALVTEHFVLQSARGVATGEAASRSSLYLTFLSGALIALGFIAQVAERFDTFAAAVLPAIVVLGEFTYVRLLENSIEDVLFQRRINRIRRYYLGLHQDAAQFFGDVLRDTRSSPVLYRSSLQLLLTAASMVAAVNSMVVGTGVALGLRALELAEVAAAAAGVLVAVGLFALHVWYERRRFGQLVSGPAAVAAEQGAGQGGRPPP